MNENRLYFEDVIRRRFSTRRFKNEPVPREDILKILEMGRIAPTAKNNQPQRIYVVTKDEDLEKLDTVTRCRYNAPLVFIICSELSSSWTDGKNDSHEIDATIVATHMMLEATNIGVDNIWIEMFDREALKKVFNIPEGIEPIALLPMGYNDNMEPSPLHSSRKSLEETVTFL